MPPKWSSRGAVRRFQAVYASFLASSLRMRSASQTVASSAVQWGRRQWLSGPAPPNGVRVPSGSPARLMRAHSDAAHESTVPREPRVARIEAPPTRLMRWMSSRSSTRRSSVQTPPVPASIRVCPSSALGSDPGRAPIGVTSGSNSSSSQTAMIGCSPSQAPTHPVQAHASLITTAQPSRSLSSRRYV